MAGRPKRAAVLGALQARATSELGEDASPLDYVVHFVRGGGQISKLAEALTIELGERVHRSNLSDIVNALTADASERIELARKDGAAALIEETLAIADEAPDTTGGVMKAKVRIGARQWWAERHAPEKYGAKVQIAVSLEQLHLDALRLRTLQPADAMLPAVSSASEALTP